jgi:hypothetical protein
MKAIIRASDIVKYTPIGGNVDLDKFLPCVLDAQITDLEPLLGESLYNKIATDYENDALTGLYETLYENYIKPFLIHASAKNYFLIGAYQINNGGIMKHTTENSESISKSEIDYLYTNQRSKCEVYAGRMKKWLVRNRIDEYYDFNEVVNKRGVDYGAWYFGGASSCGNEQIDTYEQD